MQLSISENPEMPIMEGSYMSNSTMARKHQRFNNRANLFEECRNILKKSYQNRIPSENQLLLKMIQRNEILKQMSENISLQFVRGILKNAKIQIVDERQVIVEQGQKIQYMVVVLQGKIGIQKPTFFIPTNEKDKQHSKQALEIQHLKNDQLFEKLTMLAKKQRDLQKKQSKFQRKSTLPVSEYQILPPLLSKNNYQQALQNIQKVVNINGEYGARQRLISKQYKNRVVALQKSTLLVIQISFLFYGLQAAFKTKLSKNIELLKKIACFETVEEQKLSEIILSMKLCKRKKNDFIYEQDGSSDMLYILIQGQIKLIKNTHLFKENPNNLYIDRRKLIQQIHREDRLTKSRSINKDEQVLPFANLTTLYNYRPVKKIIEIGVISSFGLFGEEEVVFKTKRQTSAIVNCLQALYYQIQIKKILEIIGPKNVDKFKEILQNSISKKVLYRQHQFADHIQFQNKVNLDYFYLQGTKQKESPRKFKLDKINQRIAPQSPREESSNAAAYYTTFNFNKMLNNKRYSEELKKQVKKTTQQSSTQTIMIPPFDLSEEKIVGISHSWNPIEKKVNQEKSLSKKISPFKHEINIEAPLIDQQFFKEVAKEQRRINKEFRTVRFSLGKKLK